MSLTHRIVIVMSGVAHRAYASVAPFRVDPSRVIAIVLHTFAIRAAEIASVSVQPELVSGVGVCCLSVRVVCRTFVL